MTEFLDRLREHETLGRMLVHSRRVPGREADWAEPERPLPRILRDALRARGIERLYRHQARGLDLAAAGRDVLCVTPTASGKTMLFALSILRSIYENPRSRALVMYPTKALAQDQLQTFRDLAGAFGALDPPRCEVYDGDTPAAARRRIKRDPPNVLITNPDMLHMGILANHEDWRPFLTGLDWIVLDELHVYRGVFGAHVHQILARLRRLAEGHGARPRFVAASATIGNPGEFARDLLGRAPEVVTETGAARAPLDVAFLNPVAVSPYTVATRLVAETSRAGLKTIAFTKARRITELLHTWLMKQSPDLRGKVEPYRAGYLPKERRAIEGRLARGELSAVLTTSALELGIDIGSLDACVLVGYPGSLISAWQRIGRVGRKQRAGLILMIAMPDALDQYVVHHPDLFFGQEFERAVVDPWNAEIAAAHLACAAAERPLEQEDVAGFGASGDALVRQLTEAGKLVQDAEGRRWFSFRRKPHRDVHPRTGGSPYAIVRRTGKREAAVGNIDSGRVWQECHPGAVYLHGGRSFRSVQLDEERRRVVVEPAAVDYYTSVLGEKETAILERLERRRVGPFWAGYGELEVTTRVRGYQRRKLFGGDVLSNHPLEAPPRVSRTKGFWIELPAELPSAFAEQELHFMGGIHAAEHAMIGLYPLLAIADRGDVGGISYTGHPQLDRPAIFVYDGVAGGAGLAAHGFRELERLSRATLDLLLECGCDDGCPGCIQSPNCGNGNKPLDKAAAARVLGLLTGREELAAWGLQPVAAAEVRAPAAAPPIPLAERKPGIVRAGNVAPAPAVPGERVLVFDLETQRGAAEVGGWGQTARMGLALAVVWDATRDCYRTYYETDVHRLLLDLVMADRVVGFNIDRFDLSVLSGYTDQDLKRIRTLDLLGCIRDQIGFRISLNHLAEANLGESKAGDGLQSLQWWREGRLDLIERYCRKDVEVTRRLFDLGRERGFLLYRDHSDRMVRLPVSW